MMIHDLSVNPRSLWTVTITNLNPLRSAEIAFEFVPFTFQVSLAVACGMRCEATLFEYCLYPLLYRVAVDAAIATCVSLCDFAPFCQGRAAGIAHDIILMLS